MFRKHASYNTTFSVNGTVAVVHFATDSQSQGTGFILEWEGSSDHYSEGSDYMLQGSNGNLTYSNYGNNELSMFVFEPVNGTLNPTAMLEINMTSASPGQPALQPGCSDSIRFYYFNLYTTGFDFLTRYKLQDYQKVF